MARVIEAPTTIDPTCTIRKMPATTRETTIQNRSHSIFCPKMVPNTAEGRERTINAYVRDWNVIGENQRNSISSRLAEGGMRPRPKFLKLGSGFESLFFHSTSKTSPRVGARFESSSVEGSTPAWPAN